MAGSMHSIHTLVSGWSGIAVMAAKTTSAYLALLSGVGSS